MQYVLDCSCVAVELERAFKYGGCNDHTYQLYYIFTDYASNNARKKITYYAGSSARILAASLVIGQLRVSLASRLDISFGGVAWRRG